MGELVETKYIPWLWLSGCLPVTLQKRQPFKETCDPWCIRSATAGVSPEAKIVCTFALQTSSLPFTTTRPLVLKFNNSSTIGSKKESISLGFLGPGITPSCSVNSSVYLNERQ